MTAKEYLQQLRKSDIMIEQKIKESEELKLKARSIKGVDYTEDRVSANVSFGAPFVNIIEKITELEKEINCEIDRFIDKKHEIINRIQGLENKQYSELLYKRYVEYKKLEVIAKEMNYSYSYIKELHGNSLIKFESSYPILLLDVL